MNENLDEIVESLESQEKEPAAQRVILVGTHQGASLVMANLVKGIKGTFTEAVTKFSARPQRSYPQKKKKGRS